MDLMIDIETMSTHPTNALVLSVGVLPFLMQLSGPQFGDSHLWVLDPMKQIASGREVLKSTADWWLQQSTEARRHWEERDDHLPLTTFAKTLRSIYQDNGEPEVWANGICFDIGNLESLFQLADVPVPWKYNAVRDARTIYRCTNRKRDMPAGLEFIQHDPVEDCRQQIWQLWEHWNFDHAD